MLSSSASVPQSFSLWILLVFKNPLLFISSMFTVARSGAVSDMYSGDAPPSLIMHKYGECATKEISCLWLELLFASSPVPFWLFLCCLGLHWTFLYSTSELLPRRIDLQWDLLGRASPLCYDRLRGWEGVRRQTELSTQITEHQKQNFPKCSINWRPTLEKGPETPPPVRYNPVQGQLIARRSIKEPE